MHGHRLPLYLTVLAFACLSATACQGARPRLSASSPDEPLRVVAPAKIAQPAAAREGAASARSRWSDGGAQVLSVSEGGGGTNDRRLILNGYGQDRIQTPFLLDTGASGSMVSASSALGREVVVDETRRFHVAQGQRAQGHLGRLPELHFGTMSSSDVVVGVVSRDHSLEQPANVLGMSDLFHSQLEHQGGRWFLRSEAKHLEPRPCGWVNVPMVKGYPLVALRDPRGRQVYGLIDTGAPTSFAVSPAPRGAYRVQGEGGATALRIPVSRTIGWRGLNLDGHMVSVLIGMDALAARDGRFTFNQAVWSMAPE